MRTCPSCGETKQDNAFWHSARRCRKCVAQARSERARDEREEIQRDFKTHTSVSGRRFEELRVNARTQAEVRIPTTMRDHVGNTLSVAAVLSLFAGIILTGDSPVFLLLGFVVFVVAGWISAHLHEPRAVAVSNLATTTLRHSVHQVDREQQEYERFYLTTDWREIRRQIIERDGSTCGCCKRQIRDQNDVTVDHIKPRSKYPELALVLSNLQVLCRSCNSSKGAR